METNFDCGGFSEDGGRVKFDENLRNSPFNNKYCELNIERTTRTEKTASELILQFFRRKVQILKINPKNDEKHL